MKYSPMTNVWIIATILAIWMRLNFIILKFNFSGIITSKTITGQLTIIINKKKSRSAEPASVCIAERAFILYSS